MTQLPALILALLLISTAHAGGKHRAPVADTQPSATPSPISSDKPVPIPSTSGDLINVRKITGAYDSEIAMIHEGIARANRMVKSPCYKQWVLAARYTENNGLTQAQIYDLQASKPTYIDIEMYYKNNGTVGFEYDPFDGVVHMNRKFVNSAYMVGDNAIHEDRGHSLEFHHYGNHATSEPYGANYAYEGCSNQMQQARGAKPFKPPGLRLEIRKRKKRL